MPRTTRRGAWPLFSDSPAAPTPEPPPKPVAVEASGQRRFFEVGALAAAAFAAASALARS
eukprot:2168854-Rhodomonas_salina.1